MPIIRSAKKKLRQDKKRHSTNLAQKRKALEVVRDFRKKPSVKALPHLFSVLDTTAKKHVFTKGKVERLKSRLSHLVKTASNK